MFDIILGILGLILIFALFAKEFKVVGIIVVLAIVIVPLASCENRAVAKRNYNKAVIAMEQNDYDKAIELLNKAIKKDENHQEAQEKKNQINAIKAYNKGNELYLANDLKGARKEAEKSLKLQSGFEEAKGLLSLIEKQEKEIEEKIKIEQENKVLEKENEKWTAENLIKKVKNYIKLPRGVEFVEHGFGNNITKANLDGYGGSKIANPYSLELSFARSGFLNSSEITDREVMKEVAFSVAKLIHDNKDRIDFNIAIMEIHFPKFDNAYGAGGNNFYIGINIIKEYFSKPRSDKVGISGATGEVVKVDFCYESFYAFIEDNFTLPENTHTLLENESWTTISKKGIPR